MDKCWEIAADYLSRGEFYNGNGSAYKHGRKHNILDEICNHKSVKKEALKYNNRSDFRDNSNSDYQYALRHKLMDKLFPKQEKKLK